MDLDDQMALEAKWHADLIANAGQLLAPMGGSTEELVGLMEEAWSLNLRAAQLYSEHMIISQELDAIQARLDEMQGEVQAAAEAARAPSCADLVILP
ncbi:MAG TPA: hypothetical protein VFT81_02545 [Dermatophilaceae bacterium]|nr:hypothetical protein [Dermatophilaceae bacterium]